MAKVVTLQILVDLDDESEIADCLNEVLRPLQRSFQEPGCESKSAVIDYKLGDGNGELYVTNVADSVENAICNETYSEGDAFSVSDRTFLLPAGKSYNLGADSLWVNAHPHDKSAEGVALYIHRDSFGVCVEAFAIGQEMESPSDSLRVEFETEEALR